MAIFDLIKPKWKHSDPQVRLQAVREMEPEGTDRLQKIAITDLDMRVRVEAVQRITDENLLSDFAASTGDSPVIEAARNQLNARYQESLFRVTDPGTRKWILEKLEDQEVLTGIAEKIDDPEIRMAATEKVTAPEQLCRIAESNCGLKTGLAIVERLDDPEHLKRVSRSATNKKVRRHAEEKLADMAEEIRPPEVESRKEAELKSADLSILPDSAAKALEGRFHQARKSLDKHLESMEQRAAPREALSTAQKARQAARQDARTAQENRLQELCSVVEAAVNAEKRTGLVKKVKIAQEEWRCAGDRALESKAELTPRFESACNRFFEKQREYREQLEWERWANLNQKEDLCKVVELLVRDEMVEGAPDVVRDARNRWRNIGPVSKEVSNEIWDRFNHACDAVYARCLAEKQALMDQLRRLTEPPAWDSPEDFNWRETAEAVKSLQARWNAVGLLPAGVEKDLPRKFQETCNTFFNRLRAFYKERNQARRENLEVKTRLTEQAEALAGSEDWAETSGVLKTLQRRWKSTGPLPKAAGDKLWERFQTACNTFFDRMKAAEPDNLTAKEALCRKAAELVAGAADDSDIVRVSRELMDLQRQWKSLGPVPAGRGEDLWSRFREPCDAFFARRNDFFKRRKAEQAENQARKQELVVRAEALSASADWRKAGDTLKSLQQTWKSLGPASPKPEQDLWERFRAACDAFFARRNDHFGRLDRSRAENFKKKEQLCISLEALARLLMPGAELSGRLAAPAEQLSSALEYKEEILVPGNRKETWARAIRKVRDLQTEWKTIGPVPADKDRDLWTRFRQAADLFFRSPSSSVGPREAAPAGDDDHNKEEEEA